MKKILVFSVALNGYQWRYRTLLNSHRRYAERNNYKYIAVTRPSLSILDMEVAWIKIRLIIEALYSGYDLILFLDADTRVTDHAPPVTAPLQPGKDIYAAKGYSGRFNSGVLLINQSPHAKQFFNDVLAMATQPIPEEDDVGWGENGYLIHLAKHNSRFGELDIRWNNNKLKTLNDYIRHYSHGPLFLDYHLPLPDYLLDRTYHYTLAFLIRVNRLFKCVQRPPICKQTEFHKKLEQVAEDVLKSYPEFKCTV